MRSIKTVFHRRMFGSAVPAVLAGVMLLSSPANAVRLSLELINGDMQSLIGIVCGVDDLENCPNPITNPSSNVAGGLPSFEAFLNSQKDGWDEVNGGGAVIGADGVSVDPVTLSGGLSSDPRLTTMQDFFFQLDGVPSNSVGKIKISDLVVPAIQTTTSDPATAPFKQFEPGPPGRVRLVLTLFSPLGVLSGAYSWWVDVAKMTPGSARSAILFATRAAAGGGNFLEYEFVNCLPVSWAASTNNAAGGTRGDINQREEILIIECSLQRYANEVRLNLQDWMTGVLSGDTSANSRGLVINHLDAESNTIRILNYGASFLTRYSFPSFDSSSDLPISEAVSIKASQLVVTLPAVQ